MNLPNTQITRYLLIGCIAASCYNFLGLDPFLKLIHRAHSDNIQLNIVRLAVGIYLPTAFLFITSIIFALIKDL